MIMLSKTTGFAVEVNEAGALGNMETIVSKEVCSFSLCEKNSAVVVSQRRLCLEHYFELCYKQLDEVEEKLRSKSVKPAEESHLRCLVEECSNLSLAVSLRHQPLTNVDRSRLLDILLWSGDLLFVLRSPHAEWPDSARFLSKRMA